MSDIKGLCQLDNLSEIQNFWSCSTLIIFLAHTKNLKAPKSLISKLLHLSLKPCYFIQFFERPPLYGALARKVYPVKPEMGFCCPRQFLDFQIKKYGSVEEDQQVFLNV